MSAASDVPLNPDGSINVDLLMIRIVGAYPDSVRVGLLRAALNIVWAEGRVDDRGSPYNKREPNLDRFK